MQMRTKSVLAFLFSFFFYELDKKRPNFVPSLLSSLSVTYEGFETGSLRLSLACGGGRARTNHRRPHLGAEGKSIASGARDGEKSYSLSLSLSLSPQLQFF